MRLILGSDHAGFKLKEQLKAAFTTEKIQFNDLGAKTFDPSDDYPDIALKVSKKVVKSKTLGLLICGTGFGICIAANKVPGVRAVALKTVKEATLARAHNNANILCLAGGQLKNRERGIGLTVKQALPIIKVFLATKPSRESRHLRRVQKIQDLEKR